MGERALDLRRSVQIVRRHKVLVCVLMALGFLAGAAYAVVKPPLLTSAALIVLPQSVVNAQAAQAGGGVLSPFTATQVVIADSSPVLSVALPNVRPAMSLNKLRNEVQVNSLTSYIISVSATSKVAADAETTANAVANSYIAYVNSPSSPTGQVQARVLQLATTATGTKPLEAILLTGLIGALAGALIGISVALTISRTDRRLRRRDEIASSIGIPVLASFPVRHPAGAAGWTKLLEDYEPGALDAWRLRHVLHQLRMADGNVSNGRGASSSLAVLSLSSDPGALAIGPQLAIFAASLGIATVLFIGPQQDTTITAALRTACTMPLSASSKRSSYLQVIVSDDGYADRQPTSTLTNGALTVTVEVVDTHNPRIPEMMRTTATVLGVSAGVATSEQLARLAVSAATDGREIVGMLVADPEPGDPTTGRVPQLPQPLPLHRMPTRLKGMTTEIRR
jgi:capsular polysaccharide biosynthesis protein